MPRKYTLFMMVAIGIFLQSSVVSAATADLTQSRPMIAASPSLTPDTEFSLFEFTLEENLPTLAPSVEPSATNSVSPSVEPSAEPTQQGKAS